MERARSILRRKLNQSLLGRSRLRPRRQHRNRLRPQREPFFSSAWRTAWIPRRPTLVSCSRTLSTNLAANGYVVAPSGTTVYGQVVEAKSAGRVSGASQLKLQLTQIIIGGNAIPIMTDVFDSQKGKSSTRRSLFRTLGGAGLGAAIGAIAGNAGVGAAIGGVAGGVGSVVQRGDQVEIPSEAQLEFRLTQPVMLPVAQ